MRNLLLLLLIVVFPAIGMSQQPNCSKFKNGTFKVSANSLDYIVTRKDSIQIKEEVQTGTQLEMKVKWISECVYTVEPTRHLKNPEDQKFPDGEIFTVTITDVKKNSYIQESTSNLHEEKRKEEYTKVKK